MNKRNKVTEIISNNILIADFMEKSKLSKDVYAILNPHTGTTDFIETKNLRYRKSFDWLMPFYAKLIKEVEALTEKKKVSSFDLFLLPMENIQEAFGTNNIKKAYENMLILLTWYNENKED